MRRLDYLRSVLLSTSLVFVSGCYRITYKVTEPPNERTYKETTWNHFFLVGLAPVTDSHQWETLCPGSKLLEVRTYNSPANVLSSFLSLGLSAGRTLEYTCVYPEGLLEKSVGKVGEKFLKSRR